MQNKTVMTEGTGSLMDAQCILHLRELPPAMLSHPWCRSKEKWVTALIQNWQFSGRREKEKRCTGGKHLEVSNRVPAGEG